VKLIGKIVITSSPKSNHYFTLGGHLAIISRDANTGAGEDFTGLAAAVQLRLLVAVGLQALQRSLNRRARGSTVATHHFGGEQFHLRYAIFD